MIELSTPIKHKLVNLGVLSKKDRKPSEDPGAQLTLSATLPLVTANHFFPGVLYLFELRPKAQGDLEEMSLEQLREFTSQAGWIAWDKEHTGHSLTIDFGLGGASNPTITDCKLHSFRFRPVEGAVECKYKVDTPDLPDSTFLILRKFKSLEISITIEPPEFEEDQQDIEDDDDPKPAKSRKAGAAERAAAGKSKLSPFPQKVDGEHQPFDSSPPPQSVTIERSQPGTRTARGRDATAEFIKAHGSAAS